MSEKQLDWFLKLMIKSKSKFNLHEDLYWWASRDVKIYDFKSKVLNLLIFVEVKELSKSQCFGELALKFNSKRAARC